LVCKTKDGKIISDERQVLKRWQQYFKEVLNFETARTKSVNIHECPINNLEPEEPTYYEINEII
jgi:hypothetical protein